MTAQEAIEQLNSLIRDRQSFIDDEERDSIYISDIEALSIAQKALEKQIPKKVEFGNGLDPIWDTCPACEYQDIEEQKPNFCPNCGQGLDWSDEDENDT